MRPRSLVSLIAVAATLAFPASTLAFYGYGAQIVSADFARGEQGDDATTFAAISAERPLRRDPDPRPQLLRRRRSRPAGAVPRRRHLPLRPRNRGAGESRRRRPLRRKRATPSSAVAPRTPRSAPTAATSPSPPPSRSSRRTPTTTSTSTSATWTSPIGAAGRLRPRLGPRRRRRPGELRPAGGRRSPGSEPGADVSRGVAITADGREVAFRTDAPTDLPAERRRRRAGGAGLRSRSGGRHDHARHRQARLRDRANDRGAGRRRARRRAQRRRHDGRLDRRQRRRIRPAFSAARTPTRASPTTSGGESPTARRRRPAGSPASPTPTIPACPPGSSTIFDQTSTGPCYGPLTDQEANREQHHRPAAGDQRRRPHGRLPHRRRAATAGRRPAPASTSS